MNQSFTWVRRGECSYEVSSRGDKRFSALFAIMPDGRTLEQHYQCDTKFHDPGGTDWSVGKGRPSVNPKHVGDRQALYNDYLDLWRIWANMNPALMSELRCRAIENNYCLSDMFATTEINQARALSDILNETINK